MSVLMSLFLGLVQGIAEFLPISSSGHLSVLQNLLNLNYSEDGHLFFDVLLHVGTLISICVVYKADLRTMISDTAEFLKRRSEGDDDDLVLRPSVRLVVLIITGTIPLVLALIFSGAIEQLYYKTGFIGFAFIITGALLFTADKLLKKNTKTEKTMTLGDAFVVGLAQALATIPGLSRSGTTIAVGLSRGLDRDFAVRFSLLLSIPAVLGSTLVSVFRALRSGIEWALIPIYLAGLVVAAIVGFFAIFLLRRLVAKGRFGNIAYYCWAVGVLTIVLSIVLK